MKDGSLIQRSSFVQWLLVQCFPQLRAWPVRAWPQLISEARQQDLDWVERLGVLVALVLASSLLRPAASLEASLPLALLGQWVFALPVLLALAGPFFLRRLRRGLARLADKAPASGRGGA